MRIPSKWNVISDLINLNGIKKSKAHPPPSQIDSPNVTAAGNEETSETFANNPNESMGLQTLKKALDKTYETLEYEGQVLAAFATGKKPPQKFSEQEKAQLLNAIIAQGLRKRMLRI